MALRVIEIVPPCSEVIEAELLLAEKRPLGLWRTSDSPETPVFLTSVGVLEIILTIAAGSAGALAYTGGLPGVVTGVMMAVALLTPAVSAGLLLGSGHLSLSLGAFLVLLANVIYVNLAGVIVFLDKGVRPRTWWETRKARSATHVKPFWSGVCWW